MCVFDGFDSLRFFCYCFGFCFLISVFANLLKAKLQNQLEPLPQTLTRHSPPLTYR